MHLDMLLILQITLNVSVWQFLLSMVIVVFAILTYSHRVLSSRKGDMEKKLDKTIFETHKIDYDKHKDSIKLQLDMKAEKESLDKLEESIFEQLKEQDFTNKTTIKMLRVDIEKTKDMTNATMNKLAEISTDIKWIRERMK